MVTAEDCKLHGENIVHVTQGRGYVGRLMRVETNKVSISNLLIRNLQLAHCGCMLPPTSAVSVYIFLQRNSRFLTTEIQTQFIFESKWQLFKSWRNSLKPSWDITLKRKKNTFLRPLWPLPLTTEIKSVNQWVQVNCTRFNGKWEVLIYHIHRKVSWLWPGLSTTKIESVNFFI